MGHRRAALLLVIERDGGPVYYAKWHLEDGTQVKRRVGPAWLDRNRAGAWGRRRGRPTSGFLTGKEAIVEMDRRAGALGRVDVGDRALALRLSALEDGGEGADGDRRDPRLRAAPWLGRWERGARGGAPSGGYSGDYDLYAREEVDALIRHAASGQDGAVYATAAMTGLPREELVALRWRDVDFQGQAIRVRGNYSQSAASRRRTTRRGLRAR
ncbi:MAG: hypothetical protein ACR2OB_00025 [Solirubrobacteraceae bacterium]